jgi:hypothetical protein
MKRFTSFMVALFMFQWLFASSAGENVKELVPCLFVYDACMEEYEALTSINESAYNSAVASCYEVYQFPYNTQCHSQAIMMWSSYQEQIFDYMVTCQNGNFGRSKPGEVRK